MSSDAEINERHLLARGKIHWIGRTWDGIPWPKRPMIALCEGLGATLRAWKRMGKTGCGCVIKDK